MVLITDRIVKWLASSNFLKAKKNKIAKEGMKLPANRPKIVYTGGTFDLYHSGHANFLRQCRIIAGENGKVVVSLNPDEFIKKFKGKAPIMTYDERKAMLESVSYVDRVIPNSGGEDSKPAILSVMPTFIVIGSDWAKKDYYKQMKFTQKWLDEHGIILVYVPYTEGISSTELKRRLTEYMKESDRK
ncbi:MAG: adenylyltransferase/cytidyltransferase family protein [Candidatus Woesearchaeota archaeon]|nr:adenylyltransferase/cytidyltransferase family protein [Candidatus Woesearchaeota archaeon]